MKVFISADMEGIAGVSAREEVNKSEQDYAPAQKQMTAEVAAACEGAFAAGADEVWIKDAHWTGRNLDLAGLPSPAGKRLRLVRGWSGHPFSMVQELDSSFTAVLFVGYHSAAGAGGNPLAHTLSSRLIARLEINGERASEFTLYSFAAASVGVPVAFLAGDEALCQEARRRNETIETVATLVGHGPSIISLPPGEAVTRIREGAQRALQAKAGRVLPLPASFQAELAFHSPAEAYRKSFYPGARLERENIVRFEAKEIFDVLRWLKFMTMG